ncbi:hypothetical protein ACFQY8_04055 [Alloscardovia venturai]|uniref:DUF4192 family protein n=1 Tax=Alloscardovia venturai TaxID=1769421 RepID=A0ABW2Y3T0_9BIFI
MNTYKEVQSEELSQLHASFLEARQNQKNSHTGLLMQWFADIPERWLEGLAQNSKCGTDIWLDSSQLSRFIVGMNAHLALRDAIILASIREVDRKNFHHLVEHPLARSSAEFVHQELDDIFHDKKYCPDFSRVDRALSLMDECITTSPYELCTALYAAQAYLLWWENYVDKALYAAAKALEIDDEYPLACITINALTHDITPAWCRKYAQVARQGEEEDTASNSQE